MNEKIIEVIDEICPEATTESTGHLVDDGVLDSLGIVTLVASLEDTFNVEIDPDDIIPENFANIHTIAQMVEHSKHI